MSKRKVPGQWILAADEVAALVTPPDPGFMFRREGGFDEQSLRRAVATVNQKRLGDPTGTVRRREDGALATRRQDQDGELYWDQTEVDDSWQVIFPTGMYGGGDPTDGWRSRAFESDFTDQEAV